MYRFIFVAAASLLSFVASAQSELGTLSGTSKVYFQRLESRGILNGCSVVFNGAVQDSAYEQGELVAFSGNVTVHSVGEGKNIRLAPGLKFGVFRLTTSGLVATAAPSFVYAKTSAGTTAKSVLGSAETDTKGMLTTVLDFAPSSIGLIVDVSAAKTVTFAYSRGERGLDVSVPVDFSVVDSKMSGETVTRTQSPREARAFKSCFDELVAPLRR
jgi:hypothetical protein